MDIKTFKLKEVRTEVFTGYNIQSFAVLLWRFTISQNDHKKDQQRHKSSNMTIIIIILYLPFYCVIVNLHGPKWAKNVVHLI